jgi:hypothetical protein
MSLLVKRLLIDSEASQINLLNKPLKILSITYQGLAFEGLQALSYEQRMVRMYGLKALKRELKLLVEILPNQCQDLLPILHLLM